MGGGGVMFWAGIIDDRMIGPFIIEDGKKVNSENYQDFLLENFFTKETSTNLKNMIFMQDKQLKKTKAFLAERGFFGHKLMFWPPFSSDLNSIENL